MNYLEANNLFANLHSEITKYLNFEDKLNLLTVNKYSVSLDYYFMTNSNVNLFKYRKCYPKGISAQITCTSNTINKIKRFAQQNTIVRCRYSNLCEIGVQNYRHLYVYGSNEKKIDLEKYLIDNLHIFHANFASISINYKNLNKLIICRCSNINIDFSYVEHHIELFIIYSRDINLQNVTNNNKIELQLFRRTNQNIVASNPLYSVQYSDYESMQTIKIVAKKYIFLNLCSDVYQSCNDKDKISKVFNYKLTNNEFSTTNIPNFKSMRCDINIITDENLYTSKIFRDITYNKSIELFSGNIFNTKIVKTFTICNNKINNFVAFEGNSVVESLVISDISCRQAIIDNISGLIKIENSDFKHMNINFMCGVKSIEIINSTFDIITVNYVKFLKIVSNSLFLAKNINYQYIPTLAEIDYIYLSGICNKFGLFTFCSKIENPPARICDKFTVNVIKNISSRLCIKLVIITHSLDEIIFIDDSVNQFEYIRFFGNIRTIEIPWKNLYVIYINGVALSSNQEYKLRKSSKDYVQYVLNYE